MNSRVILSSSSLEDAGDDRGLIPKIRLVALVWPWSWPRVEVVRSGTVRYLEQDLERRSYLERRKRREKNRKRYTRDVVLVAKDTRESFSGTSGHVPALSDAGYLRGRSSLEKSYFPRVGVSLSLFFPLLLHGSLVRRATRRSPLVDRSSNAWATLDRGFLFVTCLV